MFFELADVGDLNEIQSSLLSDRKISSRELLMYQLKVGRFGLNVELVTKLAEGIVASVRKLEGGQG